MADDNELYANMAEQGSETVETDSQDAVTEPSTLLQKLKGAISKSVQNKVESILQDVQKFTDHAKLYLYLQLPSGPSLGEKNLNLNSLSSAEHMHACTWIWNHLEEYPDTCLPKQDVYDSYKRYCDNLCSRSLSAANFGKIIREVFPNIKARRLGGRGQSKYCYSGIRRKTVVNMPPLPSLDLKETETPERTDLVQSYNDEVMDAACALTCDWAEKILKRSFNNIVEVAQFLIQQHIISSRSAHADLVMAMVVSENAENHREKHPPQSSKKTETETPDNTVKTQPESKKDNNSTPSAAPPRSEAKKPPEGPAKQARRPQVNALMARLPLLLPRIQPGERLLMSSVPTAMHSTPPILAPKLTAAPVGGTVKMALSVGPASSPLPLNLAAPNINVPGGLVSPSGAVPVINMFLPNVAVPPGAEIPSNPRSTSNSGNLNGCEAGRNPQDPQRAKAPTKRPADSSGEAATVKRKRGRPRKKLEESEFVSLDKPVAEESSAKEDSDIIVVTVGYEDSTAPSPTSQQGLQEDDSLEVEVLYVGDTKGAPTVAGENPSGVCSHITGNATKPVVLPSQVSVIQGLKSGTQVLVKEAGCCSQEPPRLGQDILLPGDGTKDTVPRDSVSHISLEDVKSERVSSSESRSHASDLPGDKPDIAPPADPLDASSSQATSMRLQQGKAAETTSPAVTSMQPPS